MPVYPQTEKLDIFLSYSKKLFRKRLSCFCLIDVSKPATLGEWGDGEASLYRKYLFSSELICVTSKACYQVLFITFSTVLCL